MKISEITSAQVINYLKEDEGNVDLEFLNAVMTAAKSYISNYTGLPMSGDGACIDSHEDLSIAFLALCSDMYDNRTMLPDAKYANTTNKTVETILGMHARTLV